MNKEMGDSDDDDDDIYEEEQEEEESDEEFDWSLNNSIFHHFLLKSIKFLQNNLNIPSFSILIEVL